MSLFLGGPLLKVFIVFISLRPEPHNPLPLHTVYVYIVYIFTQGRGMGGKVEPEREGERGNSSQTGVENTNMTPAYEL